MTKMKPQKVRIINRKEPQSLAELANTLEMIAHKLRDEGTFSIVEGEKVTNITPNNHVNVKIAYSTKGIKNKFSIEFKWLEQEPNQTITIE